MSRTSRIRHWLGLERNILVMLTLIVIVGMGEELWSRFIPKYLEILGAGTWVIASYGTLKDLLDALYQYPGGWLSDRLGRRNALIVFSLIAILGYGMYLFGASWEMILLGTIFVMAWSSLTSPAIFSIIGDSLPQERRAIGFGVQSIIKRIPIVIAPGLGGLLIASLGYTAGIQTGLVTTIVLAVVGVIIVKKFYHEPSGIPIDRSDIGDIWRGMDRRLRRLLVADCLARWAEGIPKVFVILYVINDLKLSATEFGWLTSIQMIASIAFYIPIAKVADTLNRRPFVLLTFAFFALFPLALVSATSFGLLVLSFIVGGLREIGEPARKALIVDLASTSARGRAVGLYYLIRGLVVFPASLVGGWLWTIDHSLPMTAAFGIGMAGFALYAMMGRK